MVPWGVLLPYLVGAAIFVVAYFANQARWLNARPNLSVVVIGRADDEGDRNAARDLSQQRAEVVRDRLAAAGVRPIMRFASAPKKLTGPIEAMRHPPFHDRANQEAAWQAVVKVSGVDFSSAAT